MYSRYSHSIIFSLLLLFAVSGYSQQSINTQVVAKRSYGMYLKQQWPELIAYGDSVLKLGFDYYYIRMRMGIAYYELKKYRLAEIHFKKAIEFNASEDLAFEYLYYIYIYTDRFEEARKLSGKFSATLKQKLKIDSLPTIDCAYLEAGKKISNNSSIPNALYLQLGLGHYIKNKFSLYHSYSYYGQQNEYWKVNQHQYYIGANFPLKNNWMLSGAFHIIGRNTETYSGTSPVGQGTALTSVNAYNYVESFLLKKTFQRFDVSVGSTAIWMDSVNQFQHNAVLTYYPLGNNKLGIGTNVYLHTIDGYSKVNVAYVPFVSYKPMNRLSFFGSYLYNSGSNIAEWNGFMVNNSPDLTTGRLNLNANWIINKKMDVNLTYQYENKESSYLNSNYQYNSFFIGLKSKF